jgi:multisubunit Na+/H+ antiporter MnhB subunit
MSTYPKYRRYPSSWGPVVAALLLLVGMTLLILGSWRLSDGLNGIVTDYTNPYIHFSETTAEQEVTNGIVYLFFGTLCFVVFMVLFFARRRFLFPSENQPQQQSK